MDKKKHTLSIQPEYPDKIIGIAAAENDYKATWLINNLLNINLIKINDLEITDNNLPHTLFFNIFTYDDEDNYLSWQLISNKSENGFFIPEYKNIDFFLLLKGEISKQNTQEIMNRLKSAKEIQTVFDLDINKIKSKKRLLF